jgi:hypothetical protein
MSQLRRQAQQAKRVSLLVNPLPLTERSGLLVPTPIGHGVQTPTCAMTYHLSSHRPPPPSPTGQGRCSLNCNLLTVGESATLVACCDMECGLQRLAYTMSGVPGFADANLWVMDAMNTVALKVQCWYGCHSIC